MSAREAKKKALSFCWLLAVTVNLGLATLGSVLVVADSMAVTTTNSQKGVCDRPTGSEVKLCAEKARQAAAEGEQLRKQGTTQSLQQARGKYSEALILYRVLNDSSGIANSLNNIAIVYFKLGEKQKALDYYNQVLSVEQELGDREKVASTLNNIGFLNLSLGDKQKALEYYNKALAVEQELGDRAGIATILNNMGRIYAQLGEKEKAINYYNQALPFDRALSDRSKEASTLNNIGSVYSDLGDKQKALDYYNQALSIKQTIGNRSSIAITLNNIGSIYNDLGEKQKALDYYNQALSLRQAVGDKAGIASTLNNIGSVYDDLGEKSKALNDYNQALILERAVGESLLEASTLNNIGSVYDNLGDNQKALDYYTQALSLSRKIGESETSASTLNNMGNLYNALGDKQKAFDYYNQALSLERKLGSRRREASTLNNIGSAYSDLGEKQKALDYYNQALPIRQAVGDKAGIANTLNNIGSVYDDLGEKSKALDYYNQALSLSRAIGDKAGIGKTLHNIGLVYFYLGDKQKALDYYIQALPIRQAVEDKAGVASTLNNIGKVYKDLGEKQKALDYYTQALPIERAIGSRSEESTTLNNIGNVYNALGEKQKALDYYNQSLPLSRAVGKRSGEANTLFNVAYVERSLGNLKSALTQIEASLKIIESLRSKIIDSELRTSYFASVQDYYKFYIDLLMQLHEKNPSSGYDGKALEAAERSKSRSLLELLSEARVDIREGIEPSLLERERSLLQKFDTLEKQRLQLLARGRSPLAPLGDGRSPPAPLKKGGGISGENQQDLALQQLQQENEALEAQYQELQTQIREKSPKYADLTQPTALTLKQIQSSILDDNTLLLEYSLGEERSYLWAVTKTSITSYSLPKAADIEAAAKKFRQQVTDRDPSKEELSQAVSALSQMILKPVSRELGKKRLLIVSDGALQYIPFAALELEKSERGRSPLAPLSDGRSPPAPLKKGGGISGGRARDENLVPLILEHEIVNVPSVSTLAALRNQQMTPSHPSKTLAVFADPVFDRNDPRVHQVSFQSNALAVQQDTVTRAASDAGVELKRLPFTKEEAEQILALVPAAQREQKISFSANRATALSAELSQYSIIHFATHGILNSINPESSGIVLSLVDEKGAFQNGFLRLRDIFNLKLPVNLIVLSACKTALGKEVKGEGLVGLTRGFMYAGSPRVVMSLWSVDDRATAQLMVKFYQNMLVDKLPPAAALRAAQLEMWHQKPWQLPYYWAAFTLQGEWN